MQNSPLSSLLPWIEDRQREVLHMECLWTHRMEHFSTETFSVCHAHRHSLFWLFCIYQHLYYWSLGWMRYWTRKFSVKTSLNHTVAHSQLNKVTATIFSFIYLKLLTLKNILEVKRTVTKSHVYEQFIAFIFCDMQNSNQKHIDVFITHQFWN